MPSAVKLQSRPELSPSQRLASMAADTEEAVARRRQESSTCPSEQVAVNITRLGTSGAGAHASATRSLRRLSMQARSSGCQLWRSIKATAIA